MLRPGSRCTACLTPLRFHQNIPIASFIFLSGRCGFCGIRISPRYPVVEMISAVMAVTLGVVYEPDWQLAAVMVFVCTLLTLSLIDMDHQVLPDLIVLPLLWAGVLFISLSLFVDLHLAVWGAVAGYLAQCLSLFVPNERFAAQISGDIGDIHDLWHHLYGKLPGLFVSTKPLSEFDISSCNYHFFSLKRPWRGERSGSYGRISPFGRQTNSLAPTKQHKGDIRKLWRSRRKYQ